MWKMILRHAEVQPMDTDWMEIRSSKHKVLIYARSTPSTHVIEGSGWWGKRWFTSKVRRWCKGRINEKIDLHTQHLYNACWWISDEDKAKTLHLNLNILWHVNVQNQSCNLENPTMHIERWGTYVEEILSEIAYSGTKNNARRSNNKARR